MLEVILFIRVKVVHRFIFSRYGYDYGGFYE